MATLHAVANWLYWVFGVKGSGPFYGAFSGSVGDATIIGSLLTTPLVYLHHRNCHCKGCWRLGKHQAGHYVVCKKHHPDTPDGPVTQDHIDAAHQAARAKELQ